MRYLIIEKNLGFFLGVINNYGIWAKNDIFGLPRAYSFDTKKLAKKFITDIMGAKISDFEIIEINSDEKYVHAIDLIKSGYGKHTYTMVNAIPMANETIH